MIIDVVGKVAFSDGIRALNPGGRLVLGNPTFAGMMRGLWVTKTSNKKVLFRLAGYDKTTLGNLVEQVATGKLKAVIDRKYSLEDIHTAPQIRRRRLKNG